MLSYRPMRYSYQDFQKEFPTDEACLRYLFAKRFPDKKGYVFYAPRKVFVNSKGHQIYPTSGSIFYNSSTPLTVWFHAIYLFWVSKNGISSMELQRQLGVTYKTAWRINKAIRSLLDQGTDLLSGTVEVDETYVGGKRRMAEVKTKKKSGVLGMVERGGKIRAVAIEDRSAYTLLKEIRKNVAPGTQMMTDDYPVYKKLPALGFPRQFTVHSKFEFVRDNIHTNTIEGFWSQFKRSMRGTYVCVSPKYLQTYLDEFAWRRNARDEPFSALLERL